MRIRFLIVLALLVGCGVLASIGERNPDVSLSSVREIWADVLRDTDQVGLKVTRVPAAEEMQIGKELAANLPITSDPRAEAYVTAVAARLAPHVRRQNIQYTFHVIASPEVNAFALPGGQIYVLQGLLDFLQNESELAAILGHEMSHVDLRHCIERYQYQVMMKKAGVGDAAILAEIAHSLWSIGYTQYQESEADAQGERLAIEAGYDPEAAPKVFKRMQEHFGESAGTQAETPAGEVARSVGEAIGSYFRTHPPSAARARQMSEMVASNRSRLAGKMVYVGVRNYREHIARSQHEYPEELHEFR